jgi:plastocyanin
MITEGGEQGMGKLRTTLIGIMLGLVLATTMSPAVASTRTDRPDAIQNVAVKDRFFSPARVQIHVGDRVRWKNLGAQTHTTTSDTGLWNKVLAPGATFTRTFNQVGVFRYHCTIHPEMTGGVKVVP